MSAALLFTLDELVAATGGTLVRPSTSGRVIEGVTTDSRNVPSGSVFFGVPGEKFDGSDYAGAASAASALAVVVSKGKKNIGGSAAIIEADSTLRALGLLARWHRRRMGTRIVAVTGSNGKTTTKEMLAAALASDGSVLATEGNLNNEIGVPLTLLRLRPEHKYAVIEMGMNHEGEIGRLTAMTEPDVGIVTMAAAVHTEGLGGIEGVARAKGELYNGLPLSAISVANTDDQLMRERAKWAGRTTIWFGRSEEADVRLGQILSHDRNGLSFLMNGKEARIPVVGEHNAMNACAACAGALALGVSEASVLSGFARVRLPGRRLRLSAIQAADATLLDDCYNANPSSSIAALETLKALAPEGHRVAVLGDMLELGKEEIAGHRVVGAAAARAGLKVLIAFGPTSIHIASGAIDAGFDSRKTLHTNDPGVAVERIRSILADGDVVLVKASRGTRLERVSDLLVPPAEVH